MENNIELKVNIFEGDFESDGTNNLGVQSGQGNVGDPKYNIYQYIYGDVRVDTSLYSNFFHEGKSSLNIKINELKDPKSLMMIKLQAKISSNYNWEDVVSNIHSATFKLSFWANTKYEGNFNLHKIYITNNLLEGEKFEAISEVEFDKNSEEVWKEFTVEFEREIKQLTQDLNIYISLGYPRGKVSGEGFFDDLKLDLISFKTQDEWKNEEALTINDIHFRPIPNNLKRIFLSYLHQAEIESEELKSMDDDKDYPFSALDEIWKREGLSYQDCIEFCEQSFKEESNNLKHYLHDLGINFLDNKKKEATLRNIIESEYSTRLAALLIFYIRVLLSSIDNSSSIEGPLSEIDRKLYSIIESVKENTNNADQLTVLNLLQTTLVKYSKNIQSAAPLNINTTNSKELTNSLYQSNKLSQDLERASANAVMGLINAGSKNRIPKYEYRIGNSVLPKRSQQKMDYLMNVLGAIDLQNNSTDFSHWLPGFFDIGGGVANRIIEETTLRSIIKSGVKTAVNENLNLYTTLDTNTPLADYVADVIAENIIKRKSKIKGDFQTIGDIIGAIFSTYDRKEKDGFEKFINKTTQRITKKAINKGFTDDFGNYYKPLDISPTTKDFVISTATTAAIEGLKQSYEMMKYVPSNVTKSVGINPLGDLYKNSLGSVFFPDIEKETGGENLFNLPLSFSPSVPTYLKQELDGILPAESIDKLQKEVFNNDKFYKNGRFDGSFANSKSFQNFLRENNISDYRVPQIKDALNKAFYLNNLEKSDNNVISKLAVASNEIIGATSKRFGIPFKDTFSPIGNIFPIISAPILGAAATFIKRNTATSQKSLDKLYGPEALASKGIDLPSSYTPNVIKDLIANEASFKSSPIPSDFSYQSKYREPFSAKEFYTPTSFNSDGIPDYKPIILPQQPYIPSVFNSSPLNYTKSPFSEGIGNIPSFIPSTNIPAFNNYKNTVQSITEPYVPIKYNPSYANLSENNNNFLKDYADQKYYPQDTFFRPTNTSNVDKNVASIALPSPSYKPMYYGPGPVATENFYPSGTLPFIPQFIPQQSFSSQPNFNRPNFPNQNFKNLDYGSGKNIMPSYFHKYYLPPKNIYEKSPLNFSNPYLNSTNSPQSFLPVPYIPINNGNKTPQYYLNTPVKNIPNYNQIYNLPQPQSYSPSFAQNFSPNIAPPTQTQKYSPEQIAAYKKYQQAMRNKSYGRNRSKQSIPRNIYKNAQNGQNNPNNNLNQPAVGAAIAAGIIGFALSPAAIIPFSIFGGATGKFAEVILGTGSKSRFSRFADIIGDYSGLSTFQKASEYIVDSRGNEKIVYLEFKNSLANRLGNLLPPLKRIIPRDYIATTSGIPLSSNVDPTSTYLQNYYKYGSGRMELYFHNLFKSAVEDQINSLDYEIAAKNAESLRDQYNLFFKLAFNNKKRKEIANIDTNVAGIKNKAFSPKISTYNIMTKKKGDHPARGITKDINKFLDDNLNYDEQGNAYLDDKYLDINQTKGSTKLKGALSNVMQVRNGTQLIWSGFLGLTSPIRSSGDILDSISFLFNTLPSSAINIISGTQYISGTLFSLLPEKIQQFFDKYFHIGLKQHYDYKNIEINGVILKYFKKNKEGNRWSIIDISRKIKGSKSTALGRLLNKLFKRGVITQYERSGWRAFLFGNHYIKKGFTNKYIRRYFSASSSFTKFLSIVRNPFNFFSNYLKNLVKRILWNMLHAVMKKLGTAAIKIFGKIIKEMAFNFVRVLLLSFGGGAVIIIIVLIFATMAFGAISTQTKTAYAAPIGEQITSSLNTTAPSCGAYGDVQVLSANGTTMTPARVLNVPYINQSLAQTIKDTSGNDVINPDTPEIDPIAKRLKGGNSMCGAASSVMAAAYYGLLPLQNQTKYIQSYLYRDNGQNSAYGVSLNTCIIDKYGSISISGAFQTTSLGFPCSESSVEGMSKYLNDELGNNGKVLTTHSTPLDTFTDPKDAAKAVYRLAKDSIDNGNPIILSMTSPLNHIDLIIGYTYQVDVTGNRQITGVVVNDPYANIQKDILNAHINYTSGLLPDYNNDGKEAVYDLLNFSSDFRLKYVIQLTSTIPQNQRGYGDLCTATTTPPISSIPIKK